MTDTAYALIAEVASYMRVIGGIVVLVAISLFGGLASPVGCTPKTKKLAAMYKKTKAEMGTVTAEMKAAYMDVVFTRWARWLMAVGVLLFVLGDSVERALRPGVANV